MNIALIGIRSGSKTIPNKNIKDFCGKPLVYWILNSANISQSIDQIYVLTDSELYMDIVEGFNFSKVKVLIEKTVKEGGNVNLPYQFMIDFPEIKFDNLCLLQACCPLITPVEIDRCFDKFINGNYESLITVSKQKKFIWKTIDKFIAAINYDPENRPKKQEWEGEIFEVGACYVCSKETLLKYKNFIGKLTGYFEIPFLKSFEIDSLEEFGLIECIGENIYELRNRY